MTRNSDQGKTWPLTKPCAREAEDGIQQLSSTQENKTQGFGEQMYNSNEVTQNKDMLHKPQNTNSLRDMRNNTTQVVFEGELALKLHAKDVEVGTGIN